MEVIMALKKIIKDTPYFKFHNANPKDRRTSDCVVRSISLATGISWEETLRNLTELAIKHSLMPSDPKLYSRYLSSLGWTKRPAPRKPDNRKYRGREWVEFCRKQNSILYPATQIAHIGGNHIVCIKDFRIHDTWDSTNGSIGNFWIKVDNDNGLQD